MIPIALTLGKTIFGFILEKYEKKHRRNIAAIESQTNKILDPRAMSHSWDMAQLNDRSRLLRILAFIMFASPWFGYVIHPELGIHIEKAWSIMPEWQANVISGMCLAVFGMHHIPNLIGATVSSVVRSIKYKS